MLKPGRITGLLTVHKVIMCDFHAWILTTKSKLEIRTFYQNHKLANQGLEKKQLCALCCNKGGINSSATTYSDVTKF